MIWIDRIKSEWERLTDAKSCICSAFIFPLSFLTLPRALLLRLTAISSSAKDCYLVFQSDPVFCRVPNSHSVDASTLPPNPTHREASMQSLTKPFKCPASGTKIGGNEISSQISRVHLKIMLRGWTGVLTSRLWEMKPLLLGTSLTLIHEAHHSTVWHLTPRLLEKSAFGGCFEGQWLSVNPQGQVAAKSQHVQIAGPISREGWGQDRLWRISSHFRPEQWSSVLPHHPCSYLCCGKGFQTLEPSVHPHARTQKVRLLWERWPGKMAAGPGCARVPPLCLLSLALW